MTKYRVYDPAIGRWWQADPMAELFMEDTPYNYSFNNPILYNDPYGDCPPCIVAAVAFIGYMLSAKPVNAPGRDQRKNARAMRKAQKAYDKSIITSTVTAIAIGEAIVSSTYDEGDSEPEFNPETEEYTEDNPAKEGVYEFEDTEGTDYTGQAEDMDERIKQHEKTGKKDPNTKERRKEVPGGKTQREIEETKRLDSKGGANTKNNPNPNVSNKRRPVSNKRERKLRENGEWKDN